VLFVRCGLPTANQMRVRAPPLYTASTTIYGTRPPTEGVRPCVLRTLAFEYWDAGSWFSGAERMDATTRVGADATYRHILAPQAGLGSEIAWPRIAKNEHLQM
jgi:hypothetical protein